MSTARSLPAAIVAKERTPALADGYPPEAFVAEDGEMLPAANWQMERFPKALAARARTLADVAIPARLLRKGVNVLAIEIIRSPYNKILDAMKNRGADKRELAARNCPYELAWNTCELRRVQLTAAGTAGLVPNASRPPGAPGLDQRHPDRRLQQRLRRPLRGPAAAWNSRDRATDTSRARS